MFLLCSCSGVRKIVHWGNGQLRPRPGPARCRIARGGGGGARQAAGGAAGPAGRARHGAGRGNAGPRHEGREARPGRDGCRAGGRPGAAGGKQRPDAELCARRPRGTRLHRDGAEDHRPGPGGPRRRCAAPQPGGAAAAERDEGRGAPPRRMLDPQPCRTAPCRPPAAGSGRSAGRSGRRGRVRHADGRPDGAERVPRPGSEGRPDELARRDAEHGAHGGDQRTLAAAGAAGAVERHGARHGGRSQHREAADRGDRKPRRAAGIDLPPWSPANPSRSNPSQPQPQPPPQLPPQPQPPPPGQAPTNPNGHDQRQAVRRPPGSFLAR
jgi:hypothetical protein